MGLPEALHAEWTKLRTLAGTGWLLVAMVAVTVVVSAAAASATTCPSGTACPVDTTKLSLTGIELARRWWPSWPCWPSAASTAPA